MGNALQTEQLKRFISHYGNSNRGKPLTERSARGHRAQQTAQWQAFVAADGSGVVVSPKVAQNRAKRDALVNLCVAPASMGIALERRTPEQQAECSSWEGYTMAMQAQRDATAAGDLTVALVAVKLAHECHKTYRAARTDRENADRAAGTREAEAKATMHAVLGTVAQIIHAMPDEVCVSANPGAPRVAKAALRCWVEGKFAASLAAARGGCG